MGGTQKTLPPAYSDFFSIWSLHHAKIHAFLSSILSHFFAFSQHKWSLGVQKQLISLTITHSLLHKSAPLSSAVYRIFLSFSLTCISVIRIFSHFHSTNDR
jgi:hypothetical protein